ncbi:trans-cinnamate:CoA ligase, peroxisomal-like [Malania oleifera]|uniref:trans-cinnamate:CoA ligase, peroxisomal-like n=1 Tax=Malania oleifera TaxID=397392 RepID=UPI0025AE5044|nr:trans-cinnamate:CoA ligase, peroxisomal-like [Malania oleifera]
MEKLSNCRANYSALTPITFLERAAGVYANRTSVIYAGVRFTWRETYHRCRCLAASLRSLNIIKNSVVSVLAPNIPAMYEMHFAVPMAGAVLNTINTRLDANNIATILRHSESKIFFVDYQYVPLATEAFRLLMAKSAESATNNIPLVVVIDDIDSPTGVRLGELEYEQLVQHGDPSYDPEEVINLDELDPIALNYTSGTTSAPKGVVYTHRGAYLSTLSLLLGWEMGTEPVYLWSLPMFHCNGWTFTWGVAARGGTNVCLRSATAYDMYKSINQHKVTHMCCAPVVFNLLLDAKPDERQEIKSAPVHVLTGGAPPPPPLLEKVEALGFHITHAYGLTEATGPALVCEWQARWNQLPLHDQAKLKARQGISVLSLADVDVKELATMASVPRDGKTMGEIVLRGSSIMKGYFKDAAATKQAFEKGWFRTGDMGVIHPDGYLEIKDRSKDVIISGGENISSVVVEAVLYRHPRVLEAAVVAMPHPLWGESPCAFIALKKNAEGNAEEVNEADIVSYCRRNLSGFMVPKKVVFLEELPKTSTGKIQKFELRVLAKALVVSKNASSKKSTQRSANQQSQNNTHRPEYERGLVLSRL